MKNGVVKVAGLGEGGPSIAGFVGLRAQPHEVSLLANNMWMKTSRDNEQSGEASSRSL
jgi:hypothetical protein